MEKKVRLTQKVREGEIPTIIDFVPEGNLTLVYIHHKTKGKGKGWNMGVLTKTTKRGWTYRCYWLTSKAIEVFVPREDFDYKEI